MTKLCLEDGSENADDAVTCAACGGASFPVVRCEGCNIAHAEGATWGCLHCGARVSCKPTPEATSYNGITADVLTSPCDCNACGKTIEADKLAYLRPLRPENGGVSLYDVFCSTECIDVGRIERCPFCRHPNDAHTDKMCIGLGLVSASDGTQACDCGLTLVGGHLVPRVMECKHSVVRYDTALMVETETHLTGECLACGAPVTGEKLEQDIGRRIIEAVADAKPSAHEATSLGDVANLVGSLSGVGALNVGGANPSPAPTSEPSALIDDKSEPKPIAQSTSRSCQTGAGKPIAK